MGRIPEEELERIKRGTDLKALVESGGVVLRRHGADFLGLCPFHDDREPSLVVSPKKNLWHCLGACRAGGSVIDWVMRRDGVSFRHAVEILRRGQPASVSAEATPSPALPPPSRHLPAVVGPSGSDGAMLGQVVDYYHETLKESPEALAYLERRGLTCPSLIDHFRLGYANRTLGYRIPERRLKAGEEVRGRLERLGILRGSGHEHFRGSLVVPVFGEDGTVVGIYGRKIGERLRPGTPAHLYLPGPHRGVWNREALGPEVILCESLLDAMTFWCAGLWRVTASYGVNGFTEEHLDAFRRAGVRRVLIAYDRDAAGDKAAAALVPVLAAAGIESRRVQFPRGMDANEYAQKVQPARRSLALLVEQAALLMEGTAAGTAVVAAGGGVATEAAGAASRAEALSSLAAVAAAASPAGAPGGATPPAPLPRAAAVATALTGVPAAARTPVAVAGARSGTGAEEVVITLGDRRYRVRGLSRNITADSLRINLLARRGEVMHIDTLDLYSAKQRAGYIAAAARELGTEEGQIKKDLGTVLLRLEELQEERLRERAGRGERAAVELSPEEEREALELLRSPDLLERIVGDYERCGVVGEETNKLLGYVAAVSRKLERPLAVIVQSASAAGKTSLMDAVLSFMPEEERVQYSALTGQSLFYMEGLDLRHKILAVAEEEGAERASYALKLLQSEGELTIASTGKDPETGRLVTHEYRVEGPVMIMLTTTATDIDEELLNRAIVLSVDEEREQTRRVHRAQRERRTLAGLLARTERAEVLRVHQNAQRLLRPLAVVNPYAPRLTFLDTRTRTRRDHEKYLTLIDSIALLHQYQREAKVVEHGGRRVEYIEVTLEDIEAANRLAATVLGRSLDELPPQTRRFLEGLHGWLEGRRREVAKGSDGNSGGVGTGGGAAGGDETDVAEDRYIEAPLRFSAREAREALGVGVSQTKVHLSRLLELEYLLAFRGEHGRYLYELLYRGEGAGGGPFLPGLLGMEELRRSYDAERPEPGGGRPGHGASRPERGRAAAGGMPEGGRGGEAVPKRGSSNSLKDPEMVPAENAHRGRGRRDSSYTRPAAPASANGAHP